LPCLKSLANHSQVSPNRPTGHSIQASQRLVNLNPDNLDIQVLGHLVRVLQAAVSNCVLVVEGGFSFSPSSSFSKER
jgi:hypothetical protein